MKKLDKNNIEDILPLTPVQEGMLYHYLKDPESNQYSEQLTLGISGEIDVNVFEKAWNFVIKTNEMLRTVFRWEKVENLVQIILKDHKLQLKFYDISGKKVNERKRILEEIKNIDRRVKFHLQDVPARVILCQVNKDKYEMIISNHHIIYDGWSNGIILAEFFNAYNDLSSGKVPIKPVKTGFKEFVKWMYDRDKNEQEKFWQDYLEGFNTQTELSIKRKKRKELPSTGTEAYQIRIEEETKTRLEDFARKHKITLASFLYSIWGILLQKYNNTDDVIFGTTVSGRAVEIQGIENIVGLLINTLPLRVQERSNEVTCNLVSRINMELQVRKEYEATSLVGIKEYCKLNNIEELFDTVVIIENYPLKSRLKLENNRLSIESYSMVERTHYDLTVGIMIFSDIELNFNYNPGCFDEADVMRLANHFKGIVEATVNHPGKKVSQIEIITEEEKQEILYNFNNTRTDYPTGKTIHQLFSTQAERTPDNTALIGDGQITYRELNEQSHHITCYLIKKSIKTGNIVGIIMERSIEMIIGIFGILKSGSAYLPIDPEYPGKRIQYMINDSSVTVLLTRPQHQAKVEAAYSFGQQGSSPLQFINIEGGPDRKILDEAIDITRFAPTYPNSRPIHWIVVYETDESKRMLGMVIDFIRYLKKKEPFIGKIDELSHILTEYESGIDSITYGAPHIIVTHTHNQTSNFNSNMTTVQPAATDFTTALTYLELMLPSFGLGSCRARYFDLAVKLWPPLQNTLGFPRSHKSCGALLVGYPKYKYHRVPMRNKPTVTWR